MSHWTITWVQGLTLKQKTFTDNFLASWNITQSAKKAYWNWKTISDDTASRLWDQTLKSKQVQEYIKKLTWWLWFTEDFVKSKLIERTQERTRSERSQDWNMWKIIWILGLETKNSDENAKNVLNITNITNILSDYWIKRNENDLLE